MSRLDYPITWEVGSRSLVLNGHRTDDGDIDRSRLDQTYLVEAFDFSPLDIREQREGMHLLTGGDLGPAVRQFRHISLRGVIKAPSAAALEDMEAELLAAFDIEHAQMDAPTTFGLGTLKYLTPTDVSGPDLGSLVNEGFICRPENYPITFDRRGPRGYVRRFAVQLVTGYPYRLLFPIKEVVFRETDGWTLELPNWTTRLGGTSRVTFDVALDGTTTPDTDFTISDGTRSLVLDLHTFHGGGALPGWLRVEMWSKQIYDIEPLGARRAYVRTSGIDSFFDIPAGGATVTISHHAAVYWVRALYHQTRA